MLTQPVLGTEFISHTSYEPHMLEWPRSSFTCYIYWLHKPFSGEQVAVLVIGGFKGAVYWLLRSSHMFIPGGTPWTICFCRISGRVQFLMGRGGYL
jgi:hypothetical protein